MILKMIGFIKKKKKKKKKKFFKKNFFWIIITNGKWCFIKILK